MTTETEYHRCARGLREAADMARASAFQSMREGQYELASDAFRRAHLYGLWAERELLSEKRMKELSDDESELFA